MLMDNIVNFCEEYLAIIILALNFFVILALVFSFFYVRLAKKRWNRLNDYLGDVMRTVNSVRYGDLTKKIEKLDVPNSKSLTDSINRMIDTLHDREFMIIEYQNELARQNKILEATINSLSDGLVITDEHDKILRITPLAAQWFGDEGQKLVGHKIQDFIKVLKSRPISVLKNDDVMIYAHRNSSFSASTVELKMDDRKTRHIVIIKNITDQKELETLKEEFVATLTHDLKVPIIAETNMIELFLNEKFGEINDKQRLALSNMQNSNKELLDLVQIVLETYKLGKMTLNKESIMLKGFVNEVIDEMIPIAEKNGSEIIFKSNRDIRIFADKFQLKRVLKNLIQNATSYGKPKTPIEINIGEIPNYVVIKVRDYGVGISSEDINKIFNKYYSAAKKFRKIGTGLGLYLAHQIMKAHNGDLTVESVEGDYTEFCVKIPIKMYERNII